MAQHDYSIANQGFPAFRSDLNNGLAAIVSNNSGATEPTTMFAHQIWVDTAANPSILKIRNADNDAWITIGSIDQTGDTFTMVNLKASGPVVFNDAGADVDFRVEGDTDANLLFVDAGNDRVGIGTSSPAVRMQLNSSDNYVAGLESSTTFALLGFKASDSTATTMSDPNVAVGGTGDALYFRAGGTERARIDSSGNLLVGTTSTTFNNDAKFVYNAGGEAYFVAPGSCMSLNRTGTNGNIVFFTKSSSTVGTISVTASATAYNTSSDYRLKGNVAPMAGALAKVLELNPVTYTWKADGSAGEGFIAHELQEVAPYAVTGEKDGEEMQGVDYGKITPLLTAALQEAIAEIQSLKARVAELEAK